MKLYELNDDIARVLSEMEETPEGESFCLEERLSSLMIEKEEKLESIMKAYLNYTSSATALKEEEERLRGKREREEKRAQWCKEVLSSESRGETLDMGVATLRWRQTERVEIEDARKAQKFLLDHNYDSCVRVPEPEIAKKDVKELIKSGVEVPGLTLIREKKSSIR